MWNSRDWLYDLTFNIAEHFIKETNFVSQLEMGKIPKSDNLYMYEMSFNFRYQHLYIYIYLS